MVSSLIHLAIALWDGPRLPFLWPPTPTHASTDCWGLPEAPQGLIHSGFWVSMAWIRVMHWTPHSPLSAPSPHSYASSGSFPHHFHTSTRITWLLLSSVCMCARWALSKQILPPACFVYCGGGGRWGLQERCCRIKEGVNVLAHSYMTSTHKEMGINLSKRELHWF